MCVALPPSALMWLPFEYNGEARACPHGTYEPSSFEFRANFGYRCFLEATMTSISQQWSKIVTLFIISSHMYMDSAYFHRFKCLESGKPAS